MTEEKLAALRSLIEGFESEIERAATHHANKNKGGQQVPCHGDFVSVPPMVLPKLRWWARAFKETLT